ncbi:MAG: hypothetical protein LLG14_22330 [Nocardiaceae bacterium]|nr:hypothetical protein [Nocardiaceae bacterium]
MPSLIDPAVIRWLLDGDVAVQFQTKRDLLGIVDAELGHRVSTEGRGAALLAARVPSGHWGRGFYQPKWTSSHYTLLELKNLAVDRHNELARDTVELILQNEKGTDGGLNPARQPMPSDACVNGMALNYSAYFGGDPERLGSVVDFILRQQLSDGGFNCRYNRSGARHSSVHTTVNIIEGITEYARSGYRYRMDRLLEARGAAIEFLLRHRLYRSERTGAPMSPEFTRLHHPARWHFDVLRGLDALADAGVAFDDRMKDALTVLAGRQRPDGLWAANRGYPGATHVPLEAPGQPSRWITLTALRVLRRYPQN